MRGWVKLDDGMPEHPKVEALSDNAFRAFICSIAYSGRQLTDGYLPAQVAHRYANGSLGELTDSGLWEIVEGGYVVHDYLEYQRSKADVLELREARKEAGAKGGKASSRAKDKQVLEQTPSKTQAEQDVSLVQGSSVSEPRALAEVPLSSDIQLVYDYWREKRSRGRANYDRISPARRTKIQTRLREFTAAELCAAIDGVGHDPWPDRAMHDDILVIFRKREDVERFLEMRTLSSAARKPAKGGFSDAKTWVVREGWQYPEADLVEDLAKKFILRDEERIALRELANNLQKEA